MRWKVKVVCILAALTGGVLPSNAQLVLDRSITKRLGAAYAAMINFAENPDIATANYYINNPDGNDPILRVTRLSGGHEFDLENHDWTPFVQVHIPYQTVSASYDDLVIEGSLRTKWSAVGATLTAGIIYPVTTNLSIRPAVSGGYVRIWNDGDYSGDLALLEPIFAGVITDWSSDAWMAGGSIGLEYQRMISDKTLILHAGASHNLIETFQTPRGSVEFSSYVTTFNLSGEGVHPTSFRLKEAPVSIVTILGATAFAGPYRDELGIAYFVDTGLAVELDLSSRDLILSKLRLGAKGIFGEDVTGWSAIISWKF